MSAALVDVVEHARAHADGAAYGLPDHVVDHVVDQWLDHARATGTRPPWATIRAMLVHRALGDRWHPPTTEETTP
ncbi:hypothetical protein Q8791_28960 [Nocardiopsis sp. CT-R113]|uniref:Uncharacterized protein n=1 Tax=Nocardiopsis codii TaxID=3065942 RepID=A0ABU7KI60_9ACTN|nr:hypothetical protein [Nocardiopsis sp. CT-R113]MEE2041262.1 hypothetical protein [Nocardiopsis sp. CT-R113]